MLVWMGNTNQVFARDLMMLKWHEACEFDLSIIANLGKDIMEVDPFVVNLARQGIGSLFSNWEKFFPKAHAAWIKKGLRLIIGQYNIPDLWTGKEKYFYSWFICNEHEQLIARVNPKATNPNLPILAPDKLTPSGAALMPEVAELYRYLISMDCPASKGEKWFSGPDLDFPGGGDRLDIAFGKMGIRDKRMMHAAYEALGTDKVRCLVITREKQFVVYNEHENKGNLYLIDVECDHRVRALDNPVQDLDQYFSNVISA